MSIIIFFFSVALLCASSLRLSIRLAAAGSDRFWIFIACAILQIGAIASLTSLANLLQPATWLLIQVIVYGVTVYFTGGLNRHPLHSLSDNCQAMRRATVAFFSDLSVWGALILMGIGMMLTLSMLMQTKNPVTGIDERMYHASRVIYWIQHQNIFPFMTNNIRQTVTPFGSELLFLWPVIFTKSELAGRIVFWLAYPLAAAGQYLILRSMTLNRTISLLAAFVLISTPLVAATATTLKPELWAVVALLGTAYWAIAICQNPGTTKTGYFLLGAFAVISMNIRPFAMVLLPSLLLIVWWSKNSMPLTARYRALFAGLVCATFMSGFAVPLIANGALYHDPFGPKEARQTVSAEITPKVIYTHAVRFVFLMLELPDVPASTETRTRFSDDANRLIKAIGAGAPLKMEGDDPWPGRYAYALPEQSKRFSVWGMLWIPTVLLAAMLLIRNVFTAWPRVTLTALSAQTLLALPLFGAILFGARWMTQSDVPARFLVGPYALLLPVGVVLVSAAVSHRKWAQALVAAIVLYGVYQPLRTQTLGATEAFAEPVSRQMVNEPFSEVMDVLPSGARILLIANDDTRDYPLFSPVTHYANTVIPWGTAPFDAARMQSLIKSEKVTHILIQHDQRVHFGWFPKLETDDMVNWLGDQPDMTSIPLNTPHMRLFQTSYSTGVRDGAFDTVGVPAAAPLIHIGKTLQSQVGIDPDLVVTPWPIENYGGANGSYLWIGQGYPEGIQFALWSREAKAVTVRFDVAPGPSLTTPDRRVMVLHDGVPVGDEQTFAQDAPVVFHATLHAGRNLVSFFATDAATVKNMPNGDTRHLIVYLHGVQVEEDQPHPPALDGTASDARIVQARKAIGLISSHQQADGYWITAYTKGDQLENRKQEMNTFVTSMMVDILGPTSMPGLTGSLQRARAHLHDQIESGGLVRYHGRADAPITGLKPCTITPDADDTALVWRIAPGDPALASAALATVKRFRTAEGLYQTWLAQPADYQCLNPGADPDPTDVAIQMHMYLWLSKIDPPAAHALCDALQRAIDQDRIWVYYRRAPLVPLLRQSELQAAGCTVNLPSARMQSDIAGQDSWLRAVRMLRGMTDGSDMLQHPEQVIALLDELSLNGFSAVRRHPPMLYHNDLTASVPRFYWSEDVGYAIWLRLYTEGVRHGLINDHLEKHVAAAGRREAIKP